VARDWPRWAQLGGLLLGLEQTGMWLLGDKPPNYGAMTFAAALIMIQRVAPAQQARNGRREDAP
jgi:hypothetical protein